MSSPPLDAGRPGESVCAGEGEGAQTRLNQADGPTGPTDVAVKLAGLVVVADGERHGLSGVAVRHGAAARQPVDLDVVAVEVQGAVRVDLDVAGRFAKGDRTRLGRLRASKRPSACSSASAVLCWTSPVTGASIWSVPPPLTIVSPL